MFSDIGFIVPTNCQKLFENIILPKIEKNERVNLFFSTNFTHPNYYFISQLVNLSKLAQLDNIWCYVSFADTMLLAKKHASFSIQSTQKEENFIEYNMNQVLSILKSNGIKEENIKIFRASDIWNEFINSNRAKALQFYQALSFFSNHLLDIPQDILQRYHLKKGTQYSFAYILQKYMDLFVATYFHKIRPEDIDGKIDLLISSNSMNPICIKVREICLRAEALPKSTPLIVIMPNIPCFGHSQAIDKKFIIPHWNMDLKEIYEVIDKYNVSKKHASQIMNALDSDEIIIVPKSNRNEQKKALAKFLYNYLKNIKEKVKEPENKSHIELSKNEDISILLRLLKSEINIQVLRLCDGQHSISKIAKKLDKHLSNTSKIIRELKLAGLIETNESGKPFKKINTIKVNI